MKYNRLSVQTKLVYIILVFSVLALSAVGYIGYRYTKDAYISKIIESENTEIRDITSSINDKLSIMKQDANFIANFYAMQKLLNWQSIDVKIKVKRWNTATKDTFKSLIDLKKFYYKLRILDLSGQEKITVFYDEKKLKSFAQSDDKLQNRSKERYYFEAINLNMGEVYISQMELNVEFGKIVSPHIPVVHFSAVIYDKNGDKRGLAVINAYAKNILDSAIEYHNEDSNHKKRMVIDNDGYFLYHENDSKRWGKQLGTNENYKNYNPEVFKELSLNESGTYEHNNKLFSYVRIYPDSINRSEYWIIVSEVNNDTVFATLKEFQQIFYITFFLIIAILVFSIRTYVTKILSPLNEVTNQLKSLSKGEIELLEIKYNGEDEIKDLINSSKKLVHNIKNTIEQAKAVASGDFSKRIQIESEKDALGNSINEMTNKLDATAKLTKKLSNGDISSDIIIDNKDDTLSVALNELLRYLKEITYVAESVSVGDFDVNFNVASKKDRLGIAVNEMMKTLKQIVEQANSIADGDFSQSIKPKGEKDRLGFALKKMTNILDENRKNSISDNWLKDGLGGLNDALSGAEDLTKMSNDIILNIVKHVNGASGVFFIYNKDENELYLQASYAFVDRESLLTRFKPGQGVIGQVALEHKPILLKNLSKNEFVVQSGIVNKEPLNTYTFPIIYEGNMLGVAEVASFNKFDENDKQFMDKAARIASAFLYNATQNRQIKQLLEESQRSFEELQVTSEELQQSNVQMEEQQQQLEVQARDLKMNNDALETTKNELDVRATELEKSSQYKSEFLANMSHELRTPLNSIILLSKMLSEDTDGELSEDNTKKASVIHKSGQDLLLLINDILDLSKIESGKMELINDDVATAEITSEMYDLFSPLAKENGLEFILDDKYNSAIRTDRVKLSQILKNLLSNAFKFTKEGSVTLGINYKEDELLPISIYVKDTGIGIPEDKKHIVFDAFKQVDGSISRQYGGTGLGLSISKKFTELLGGKLSIDSNEDLGSTFTINLPLNKDLEHIKDKVKIDKKTSEANESKQFLDEVMSFGSKSNQSAQDSSLNGKRILIVDDDSRNIFSLSASLQSEGSITLHALNGKNALKILDENKVDLVLMDIMMPEMDGYTTIEKIREQDRFKELPIIAVTAKAMKEDKQKCLDVGADDYLAKPIDLDSLLIMTRAWVSKQ